ncbi:MAG: SGNH/GDSL hydrolase family protein [Tateyamaria sp.]
MIRLPTLALLPVVVPQALWVAARAERLPEADGPRSGESGEGPVMRLLIVGDSSAAGVGVAHQNDALSGRLVARLSKTATVQWSVWAASGLTTSGVLRRLAAEPVQQFDIAVLAVGVNDAKNGVHATRWSANYRELLRVLRARFGVDLVLASGVPPLEHFPLLPRPLRTVLGARAAHFDDVLGKICAASDGVTHMPFGLPLDSTQMASDGFHPGAAIYDLWAERLAAAIREQRPTY